jgi:hypothetical protein
VRKAIKLYAQFFFISSSKKPAAKRSRPNSSC